MTNQELSAFIWSVADLLSGDYKPHEPGQVILPFTVLRRLNCALADTKQAVLKKVAEHKGKDGPPAPVLERAAKQKFYNTSKMDMQAILGEQDNIRANLFAYLQAFSPSTRTFSSASTFTPR